MGGKGSPPPPARASRFCASASSQGAASESPSVVLCSALLCMLVAERGAWVGQPFTFYSPWNPLQHSVGEVRLGLVTGWEGEEGEKTKARAREGEGGEETEKERLRGVLTERKS